jgi:hypothetical protein
VTKALLTRVPGGKLLVAAQIVLAAYYIGNGVYQANRSWHLFGGGAPKPDLYGIWSVDRMFVNGVERSALVNDYGRWRRVIIQNQTTLYLWRMDDTFVSYPAKYDANARSITLTKPSDKNWTANLAFQRPDRDHLIFTGAIDGQRLELRTTRIDREKFLLVSRGFNWVQEFPFNR